MMGIMDCMSAWIKEENYQIKTDMEWLVEVVMNQYQNHISHLEHSYMDKNISEDDIYLDTDKMVEDIKHFVKDNGGLKEFDKSMEELLNELKGVD